MGPLMNEAKDLMNELSLNEKIVLLGPQPHLRVLKEMEEADIFFLPSLTAENGDREGYTGVYNGSPSNRDCR